MSQKIKKILKLISLLILLLSLLYAGNISVLAAGELTATKISRISHPAYEMTKINYSDPGKYIFNVDGSRILMSEAGNSISHSGLGVYASIQHPQFPSQRTAGRGLMWGCIKPSCVTETGNSNIAAVQNVNSTLQALNLDNLSGQNAGLAAWDINTVTIPAQYRGSKSEGMPIWSPFPGETSLLYAVNYVTKKLVTYNVDTGVEVAIIALDNIFPGDSQSYYDKLGTCTSKCAGVVGFTRDKTHIFVDLQVESWTGRQHDVTLNRQSNGTFLNPTAIPKSTTESCSRKFIDGTVPTDFQSVHGGHTYDGTVWYRYAGGTCINSGDESACGTDRTAPYGDWTVSGGNNPCYRDTKNQEGITHIAGGTANDWVMGGALGTQVTYPNIGYQRVSQIYFDKAYALANCPRTPTESVSCDGAFRHHNVINRLSARSWEPNGVQANIVNYGAIPSAVDSPDHTLITFWGTNNKYTRNDRAICNDSRYSTLTNCSSIGTNWEATGVYLAEVTSDTSPQLIPADINQDGKINIQDFIALVSNWLQTFSASFPASDINKDGAVNTRDLGIMMTNWQ